MPACSSGSIRSGNCPPRNRRCSPGLLTLEGESYPLLKPGAGEESVWGFAPWRYEVRQGRNPNGGEAVCLVRPLFEEWGIHFTAILDTDELAEDTFLRLFQLAGRRIGFCDYRPQRKGVFGMFAVTRWERRAEENMSPIDAVVERILS